MKSQKEMLHSQEFSKTIEKEMLILSNILSDCTPIVTLTLTHVITSFSYHLAPDRVVIDELMCS